jgi:hypothetical protein
MWGPMRNLIRYFDLLVLPRPVPITWVITFTII